jgi:hypothetical protein
MPLDISTGFGIVLVLCVSDGNNKCNELQRWWMVNSSSTALLRVYRFRMSDGDGVTLLDQFIYAQ